jgi:hypothetical protein
MRLEVSTVIARTPAEVFRFVATDHVRNHPRWDPSIALEQVGEGAIEVGTVIRRRHARQGEPVEGTLEVTEFEQDRSMAGVIHEGGLEMWSRMDVEPEGDGATTLTLVLDIPTITDPMDPSAIEGSLARIKELIESS